MTFFKLLLISTPLMLASAALMFFYMRRLMARTLASWVQDLNSLTQQLKSPATDSQITALPEQFVSPHYLQFSQISQKLALWHHEQSLSEMILDCLAEGILVVGQTGHIQATNRAFRDMWLLSKDILQMPLIAVIRHAELADLLEQARDPGLYQGIHFIQKEIEVSGLKPRKLRLKIYRLKADYELRLLVIMSDITDVRRLEALERDFVANVSHELRTPLSGILSSAETLIDNSTIQADDQLLYFIQVIMRQAGRLKELVEDVLELSRLDAKAYQLKLGALNVYNTIAYCISLLDNAAAQKEIHIEVAPFSHDLSVWADRRALERIVINLIDNAIKYCPIASRIIVTATADNSIVTLTIRDNGPGIEPQHIPRLFERFYRVEQGRSRELGGTGLGLAIVKTLCQAQGGEVTVTSELGHGTCFVITLNQSNQSSS